MTYTLEYANAGSEPATNVQTMDALPENLHFVSATGGGVEDSGQIVWKLGKLPGGASGAVELVAQIASPLKNDTVIANTASIESGGGQIAAQSPTVTLRVISAPKVALNKGVDMTGKVSPGDILTYTLSYNNTSNAVATRVVLSDKLSDTLGIR